MKHKNNGFTLMEMLIVVAIIAILISIAIPVFSSQLEKAREATDLSNVRSAFAQVTTDVMLGDSKAEVRVNLKQKIDGFQSVNPVNIGGIVHAQGQADTPNWKGNPEADGTCIVSFSEDVGVVLTWSGKTVYPFNTGFSSNEFFGALYDTDFWSRGDIKYNSSFEFDSRCPNSTYIPSIETELGKLNNNLLQQPDCTWAYLGDGRQGKEANRYLFWTSLNTDNVGAGEQIPVIIQTGDGKYYVAETTTGQRKNKDNKPYVAVSDHLKTPAQFESVLTAGQKYDSIEQAYDAYLKALNDPKYDTVRNSSTGKS